MQRFADLYSVVYDLIDDAKRDHDLVALHKGSHGSPDPHPVVLGMGRHLFDQGRGLLSYVGHRAGSNGAQVMPEHLLRFDLAHQPRISTRAIAAVLAATIRRDGESARDLLARLAARPHRLGQYRGGSSGFDEEARAVAVTHLRQAGIPAGLFEVMICCGGAKGVFMSACGAVMCRHENERVHRMSGRLLAPVGYYQSLRVVPPVFGGTIDTANELTGQTVAAWLQHTSDVAGRIVYVPLVNNVDGQVLDEPRAHGIAEAVLTHNHRHPANPVWVLGDDVYIGSYLDVAVRPTPIGSVTGTDLGAPELGSMTEWTVTVVTSSKTFALPTARVAFAHTSNRALRTGMAHYATMLSHGRIPQGDELTAAAALALTPQSWIDDWNNRYQQRLRWLSDQLDALNTELGRPVFRIIPPQGGWYVALRIHPRLLGDRRIQSSVDMLALLLHYDPHRRASGLALLPGELSGYRVSTEAPEFVLRLSVAVDDETLRISVARLREAALTLSGPDAGAVIDGALRRAEQVAPATVRTGHMT
ncbi:aminotransferase class I/II-fold pyridoxal phosphate-dependent enzyme [Saccharopolyspora indica]|uniref:aminotransferase class I/II-fold pyridoxal phosphate-dependent enzyme n=1 Tax=Saccharopolyspora indica TaxID=1229659 RepID=UPI0022EAE153|nr:aminotransferase class I/II-fold pyridoxal phosphate-dependent enzyme [Saccharopolyspora indica]MDA3644336.1 aminotransferase class I/II-fold pyridoxal phosphate-dependent enzyme [Saccharopolyspora indica]